MTSKENSLHRLAQLPFIQKVFQSFIKITHGMGVPDWFAKTIQYKENIFIFLRERADIDRRAFPNLYRFLAWGPVMKFILRLSQRFSLFGLISLLYRIPCMLAFDQPPLLNENHEIYEPLKVSKRLKSREIDFTLPRYGDRFFYDFGNSWDEFRPEAVQQAFKGTLPEYLCIGSGPGVATALKGILEVTPHATAWILDQGDYFTEKDYLDMTPLGAIMNTYYGGGLTPIFNSLTRVTGNIAPKVWGGGNEIFSGTAYLNEPWYIRKMGLSDAEYHEEYQRIARECRIGVQKWELTNVPQKRFWDGAKACGYSPEMLTKFGADLTEGRGRNYAGFKGRIPYLDDFLSKNKNIRGIANCRVERFLADGGRITGIEVAVLGRCDRKVLKRLTLAVPLYTKVLLGAGSLGNYGILKASGVRARRGAGVIHQYTVDVLGLFDDEMPANGSPQAIGLELEPGKPRGIMIEGGRPPRAVLNTVAAGPVQDMMALREALKKVGSIATIFTEETPGRHFEFMDNVFTYQPLTRNDYGRALFDIEKTLEIWKQSGARAMGLNMALNYPSRDPKLRAIGYFDASEIGGVMEHLKKIQPVFQAFYRTGNLFGVVNPTNGVHPEIQDLYVVSEDVIPPGPGVNPTLGQMILVRRFGREIAKK